MVVFDCMLQDQEEEERSRCKEIGPYMVYECVCACVNLTCDFGLLVSYHGNTGQGG